MLQEVLYNFLLQCNAFLILCDSRSFRDFTLSFVFPLMFSNVPTILSPTFFSICMKSRQCWTGLNFQYGSSRYHMLNFFQWSSGLGGGGGCGILGSLSPSGLFLFVPDFFSFADSFFFSASFFFPDSSFF